MSISLRGLHLTVAQEPADHLQRGPAADQQGREGVAKVMDTHIRQIRLFLNACPEPADFANRLAYGLAGEQPWVAIRYDHLALAHDCHHLLRNRHSVDLALLGGRGGFRPDDIVEVELLKACRPYFADARTGQHAHADDRCPALILGAVEYRRDAGQFLGA